VVLLDLAHRHRPLGPAGRQPSRSGISLRTWKPQGTAGSRSPDRARVTLRSLRPGDSVIALRPSRSGWPRITFAPCGPRVPVSPFGPSGPGGPIAPGSPFWPSEPITPIGPASPAGPCGPAGPASPASPFRARRSCVASGTSNSFRSSGSGICERRSNNPSLKRAGFSGSAGAKVRQQISLCVGRAEGGG
jgi:hypothetical protein